MSSQVTTTNDNPNRQLSLDEIVDAFEVVWNRDGTADVEDFLPDASHPDFEEVAVELLCVDLERRWEDGQPKKIEDYRQQYPRLLATRHAIGQLSFEEYRLRRQNGESVTPADYSHRFDVDTDHWPQQTHKSGETDAILGKASTMRATSEMDRLTTAAHGVPQAGERCFGFELIEQLGEGKFSRVYLARQADLANRLVVVKITTDIWAESDRLARLQHTNIVPIYSVHQQASLQAVCMPYFGRHTLADVLQKLGDRIPLLASEVVGLFASDVAQPAEASVQQSSALRSYLQRLSYEQLCLWIAARVADGLSHAHERGILHRDLKPANILMTEEGQPMILDFNLSEDIVAGGSASLLVGGTLPYMSPEHLQAVASGSHVDLRGDIYSLGVILFQMLTGRLPFSVRGGSIDAALPSMIAERLGAPPSVRAHRPAISPAIDSIVQHCLAPHPGQRYQSARQLQEDLERQLKDYPLRHAPDRSLAERTRKWFRRHPRVTSTGGLAAVAAVILAAIVTVLFLRGREVARLEAMDVYRRFESRVRVARAPLTVPTADEPTSQAGFKPANEALALYNIGAPRWQEDTSYRLLDGVHQQQVDRYAQELLFLSAHSTFRRAKWQDNSDRRQSELEKALQYNQMSRQLRNGRDAPPALLLQQADIVSALGREDEARKLRRMALDEPLNDAIDRYYDAIQQMAHHRYAEAAPVLEELRREAPQNFFVWFLLGNSYAGTGDFSAAEPCFTTCAALWPDSDTSYFHRGLCRLEQNRFAAAEQDFTEALRLQPKQTAALVNRALARQGLGRRRDAIDDVTKAIQAGRDDSRVYLLRSRLWQEIGSPEKAKQDKQEGLRRAPVDEVGWIYRGMARLADDPEAALADLQAALEMNPRSRKALQNIAHLLSDRLDRPDEAIQVLSRMLELNPRDATALAGRGVLRARRGQRDAAIEDGREALKSDRSAQTVYQVACILAQTSKVSEDDAPEAVRLLGDAFRRELRWARLAPRDPDLEPVVQRPDFRKAIAAAAILHQTSSPVAGDASHVPFIEPLTSK